MRHLLFYFCLLLAQSVFSQVTDSAKRRVSLQGAVNFRDLGGYTTTDGHHIKWNKIYRSADISHLTDSDMAVLRARHITSDVDLRGVEESAKAPDRLNPHTDYILCPAGSDSSMNNWMKQISGLSSGGDSLMLVFYKNTTYLADRYRPFFNKLLALPDTNALLFHCTAGKDRTGIGAALLLYALGVPYPTIEADYVATNYYRAAANEKMVGSMVQYMHMNEGVAKDMLSAKKEYLQATFNAIREQYGSIDQFLKMAVGLDEGKIGHLKEEFLY